MKSMGRAALDFGARGVLGPMGRVGRTGLSACLAGLMLSSCAPGMREPAPGRAPRAQQPKGQTARRGVRGVCPPFKLRDAQGRVIDPVHGLNATEPYSPKQTCGRAGCHDYARITQGYHFTHGKGEAVPPSHKARYAWVSSPGQYGGRW